MTVNRYLKLFVILSLSPVTAQGGPCDATYAFDGDLADSTGNGNNGQMIGAEGAAAIPQFVEGKFGQALKLDGSSAMRSYIDLHYDRCPQITVTAWINVDPGGRGTTQYLFATGGSGPGLRKSGNVLSLDGLNNGIMDGDAVQPGSGWMFVAGVYDYTARKYSLHWRSRTSETHDLGDTLRSPGDVLMVGALDKALNMAAAGVAIDNLQVFGRALSREELIAMNDAEVAAPTPARTVSGSTVLPACATHADCGANSYCAFDNSCHPQSHLPKQDVQLVDAPVRTIVTYPNPSSPPASGGSGGITGSPVAAGQMTSNVPEMQVSNRTQVGIDGMPDMSLDQSGGQPDFNMDEAVAAAGANRIPSLPGASGQTQQTAPPDVAETGVVPDGYAGKTVRGVLGELNLDRPASGDVQDCTSLVEVPVKIAKATKQLAIEMATERSCSLLDMFVERTMTSKYFVNRVDLSKQKFDGMLLNEFVRDCTSASELTTRIVDSLASSWAEHDGVQGWLMVANEIGPRKLTLDTTHSGSITAPGDRKFITEAPVLGRDSVYVTLQERQGKARTNVRICTVSMLNEYRMVHSFSVNETDGERDNENQLILQQVADVRGQQLIVFLNSGGRPGRQFAYTLRVE